MLVRNGLHPDRVFLGEIGIKIERSSQRGVDHLNELFHSVQATAAQLADAGEETSLPPDIAKAVEGHISPDYLRNKKRDEARNLLNGGLWCLTILNSSEISWLSVLITIPRVIDGMLMNSFVSLAISAR